MSEERVRKQGEECHNCIYYPGEAGDCYKPGYCRTVIHCSWCGGYKAGTRYATFTTGVEFEYKGYKFKNIASKYFSDASGKFHHINIMEWTNPPIVPMEEDRSDHEYSGYDYQFECKDSDELAAMIERHEKEGGLFAKVIEYKKTILPGQLGKRISGLSKEEQYETLIKTVEHITTDKRIAYMEKAMAPLKTHLHDLLDLTRLKKIVENHVKRTIPDELTIGGGK